MLESVKIMATTSTDTSSLLPSTYSGKPAQDIQGKSLLLARIAVVSSIVCLLSFLTWLLYSAIIFFSYFSFIDGRSSSERERYAFNQKIWYSSLFVWMLSGAILAVLYMFAYSSVASLFNGSTF